MQRGRSGISKANREKVREMYDRGFNAKTISMSVGVDVGRVSKEISDYDAEAEEENYNSSYHHFI